MSTLKTVPTDADVSAFLATITPPKRAQECQTLCDLIEAVTGEKPQMWGETIVGFGRYVYTYASGRSGEWMKIGFAPRKHDLTLYIMSGFTAFEPLLSKLGKHKIGKSCLYLKSLEDVDTEVLKTVIRESIRAIDAGEISY